MSREIVINMWCSQIPDIMFESWVSKKYIKKSVHYIVESEINAGKFAYRFEKEGTKGYKWAYTTEECKKLKKSGWKITHKTYCVSPEIMDIIQKEVGIWYKDVFLYTENWLTKNDFIHLKQGSFRGGFSATDVADKTTKEWGAPLAAKKNKVSCIKEKFGRVTVYFNPLKPEERAKVEKFENSLIKRFDCATCFC